MKNKTYILDIYFKKYYGPYTNRRKLDCDIKLVKRISDSLLEEGTNVIELDTKCLKLIVKCNSEKYSLGNIEELKEIWKRSGELLKSSIQRRKNRRVQIGD